jgi:O-antigen ligase
MAELMLSEPKSGLAAFVNSIERAPREFVVGVLLASFVVAVDPGATFTFWTPATALTWLIAPLALLTLLRAAIARDRIALVGSALAGSALVSSLLSTAPIISLIGMSNRWNTWLVFATGLGCWALARELSPIGRRNFLWFVVVGAGLSGFVGVLQMIVKPEGGFLIYSFDRASGLAGNPVYLAAHVGAGAAFFAYRLASRYSLVDLLLFSLFVFFVALTGSRVAVLAVLVMPCLIALRTDRKTTLSAVFATIGSLMLGEIFQKAVGSSEATSDRVTADGLGIRLDVWRFGLRGWVDHPVLGWGAGNFRAASQGYYSDSFVYATRGDDVASAWFDSHNLFVQVLVSFGAVGTLLFVAFLVLSSIRATGPGIWMAATMLLTWQLQPAVQHTWPVGLALLGASCGSVVNVRSAVPGPSSPPRMQQTSLPAFAASMILGLALSASLVLGDRAAWGIADDLPMKLPRSTWMYSNDAALFSSMADQGYNPGEVDEGRKEYDLYWLERATDAEPSYPLRWSQLGLRRLRYGDVQGARDAAERGVALQPTHNASWIVLRIVGEQSGDDGLVNRANEVLCRFDLGDCD